VSEKITADDLRKMLRKRYGGGGHRYALFDEVHDATGYQKSRSCDAIAMALWPSDGLEIHGFEIKVSRADFQNEIRDPDKSQAFKRYCDRWWLVAGSKGIVQNDLPHGWGMMWARAGKLVVSVGAPKLEPEPMPREMLAAILRRAVESSATKAALDESYERGRAFGEKRADREKERTQKLKDRIAVFEESSGIKLDKWGHWGEIGAAVKVVQGLHGQWGSVEKLASAGVRLGKAAHEITMGVAQLREAAAAAGIQTELDLPDDT
jgi:hypothetical protein